MTPDKPTLAAPPAPAQTLAEAESSYTTSLRKTSPGLWAATLFGPFVLTGAALAVAASVKGLLWTKKLVLFAIATFFVFGKFVILGGGEATAEAPSAITRGELMLLVIWMDVAVAVLFVWHAGFLFKLPFLGPRLAALVEDGQFILGQHPWMRRVTFTGLVIFVLVPLAATGAVGGAIFGRLLGLSRPATFVGIALGSVLGCLLMYLGAGFINRHIDRDNPWLVVGGAVVILGLILLLNMRYQRMKKRALADKPRQA